MLEEEQPILTFVMRDMVGRVTYRDSLTFESIAQMRATSKAERQKMMQDRYDEWWKLKQKAKKEAQSEEEKEPEEG